ncbi:hypothetical protein ACOMHN_048338 [Nucella lapillus]
MRESPGQPTTVYVAQPGGRRHFLPDSCGGGAVVPCRAAVKIGAEIISLVPSFPINNPSLSPGMAGSTLEQGGKDGQKVFVIFLSDERRYNSAWSTVRQPGYWGLL